MRSHPRLGGGAWHAGGARVLDALLVWVCRFAAFFVPYYLWRYDYYGWFFPNTYYAKVGASLDQYDRGVRYLDGVRAAIGGMAAAARAARDRDSTPMRRARAAYVFTLRARVVGVRRRTSAATRSLRFRFFAPVLPLFYALITVVSIAALIAAAHIERAWCGSAERGDRRSCRAGRASRSCCIRGRRTRPASRRAEGRRQRAEIGALAARQRRDGQRHRGGARGRNRVRVATSTSSTCSASTTSTSPTATCTLGEFPAGHEKYDSDYVLDLQPDIIILYDGLSGVAVDFARTTRRCTA